MSTFSSSIAVQKSLDRPARLVVVCVGDAPDLAAGVEAALTSAGVAGGIASIFGKTPLAATQLAAFAGADVVLVATRAADHLSADVKNACLLASRLSVGLPILILAEPSGMADAEVAATYATYAKGLGSGPAMTFSWPRDAVRVAEAASSALAKADHDREAAAFRFWVDNESDARAVAGTAVGAIVAGHPTPGLDVVVMPAATPAKIASVDTQSQSPRAVLRLDGGHMAATAGQLIAAADARPELADQIAAEIVWTSETPLLPGRSYVLGLGPQRVVAQVSTLKHKLDPTDLGQIAARRLAVGELGNVNLSFAAPILFDPYDRCRPTGRFQLEDADTGQRVAWGNVLFTLRRATNIHWQSLAVDKAARAQMKGQTPCCLWFTGLSGSGKSTVASLLEKRLNALGRHTYTLDGDNVRHGLNRDLGFTEADRVENIRRVAEVSKLFVDAGLIVLVSFISPFRAERRMARTLLPESEFIEVFVDTSIEVCEARDPKGLYKKARAGQLKNFTGIDSPYEPPESPEMRLAAGAATPGDLVEEIMVELARRGVV